MNSAPSLQDFFDLFRRTKHPRNGKIARLPEPTRNLINRMLDDGFRYRDIIIKLQSPGDPSIPPLPYPLSEMNLSNWRKGGFQDYCRRQFEQQLAHALTTHAPDYSLPSGGKAEAAPGERKPSAEDKTATFRTNSPCQAHPYQSTGSLPRASGTYREQLKAKKKICYARSP